MKISYAITVCNEFDEIQRLINFLLEKIRYEDEIVVLFDSKNGSPTVEEYLRAKSINGEFNWHKKEFEGHLLIGKITLQPYVVVIGYFK